MRVAFADQPCVEAGTVQQIDIGEESSILVSKVSFEREEHGFPEVLALRELAGFLAKVLNLLLRIKCGLGRPIPLSRTPISGWR